MKKNRPRKLADLVSRGNRAITLKRGYMAMGTYVSTISTHDAVRYYRRYVRGQDIAVHGFPDLFGHGSANNIFFTGYGKTVRNLYYP